MICWYFLSLISIIMVSQIGFIYSIYRTDTLFPGAVISFFVILLQFISSIIVHRSLIVKNNLQSKL